MKSACRMLLSGLLVALPLVSAWSQDSVSESAEEAEPIAYDEPVDCVNITRIDETEVIDDRRIAFHMRNGDIYINELDRSCRDLRPGRPFSYRTSTGRICSVDVITIINRFGSGLAPGISCGLGVFVPVDEELLEIIKEGDGNGDAEVSVTEIEVSPEPNDR